MTARKVNRSESAASWPSSGPAHKPFAHRGLVWALGISLAVHMGLLTWRFAAPQNFDRVFRDTPLEVILVNARSEQRPQETQALAQVQLAGGGEMPQVHIASAHWKPALNSTPGQDIRAMQREIEALKMHQMRLLTQLKQELSNLTRENAGDQREDPDRPAREQRQQQLTQQLAQIEQRVDQTQGGPRKRYISPATQEVVYALYYDKLRRAIEYQGTLNFPEAAGEKMYGQLTMVITVDRHGQLLQTEVAKPSGKPLLDERAVAIVRSSAPFGAFSPKMRTQADQIVVVTRFDFSKDNTLETRMLAPEKNKP